MTEKDILAKGLSILTLGFIVYAALCAFRHELDIAKPKYKEQACLTLETKSEFNDDAYSGYTVTKVGKKSYLLKYYSKYGKEYRSYSVFREETIKDAETRYREINCPERITNI